ncbi:MAG: NAD(+) diphosphatase [Burkholderiales bacterium]
MPEAFLPCVAMTREPAGTPLWFVFQASRLLVFENNAKLLVPEMSTLSELDLNPVRQHYLGQLLDQPCYCAELADDATPPEGASLLGLRDVFGRVADDHFALAGRAIQILNWDRSHQYCGACATPTKLKNFERARECPNCGLVSYPRLAPAVMALVRRGHQLLLARSPHFPAGMYSALAGFVDPGESLEQTIAREVQEEVGLQVCNVRYFASQPWPFPHSLMIAFTADYLDGEITPDPSEIEDAQWFELDSLPRLPNTISISRRLIDSVIADMQGEAI